MTRSHGDAVRVMIVEDSLTVRAYLENLIMRDPRLRLVASAGSAEQAIRLLPRTTPDVISMDLNLPGMDGLAAIRRIMSEHPIPIVVISASVGSRDVRVAIEALRAGALMAIETPHPNGTKDRHLEGESICEKLILMSQVKVVRQRFNRHPKRVDRRMNVAVAPTTARPGEYDVIGMVASTGGPAALERVLGSLPSEMSVPIVLVQHITDSFLPGFVAWLRSICPLKVEAARLGGMLTPGCVHIAPAKSHLWVGRGGFDLLHQPPVSGQRPSGTVLLHSLAENFAERAVGVVLTGMGNDGAAGLRAMRDAGGYTIAEHASTAVVNGMPGAAVSLGAAVDVLPLDGIAHALTALACCTSKGVA